MRLRHLRYFLIVAQEKSFTRAAPIANIEPSPLSRAIKELENQLGVQLLHRVKGRIQLTWAGEVFRDEARRILDFIDSAQMRVQSAAQGYRGRLRIGLCDSLAQPNLTRLLARSREDEARTEIRITELTSSEMLQAIQFDQLDAGFTIDGEDISGYRKLCVWKERLVVAVPTHHPLLALEKVPLCELLRYPLVLCHPERCAGVHRVTTQWLCQTQRTPPMVAEYVSGHESMMMLVAAGYGIGIGLASQLELYNHSDVVIRPTEDEDLNVTTFLAVSSNYTISPELERFIQRAQEIGSTFTNN